MKAAIYIRVSTEEQGEKGASMAEQQRRCQQWIEMKGHDLIGTYEDIGSGFTTNREGFQEMMAEPEWGIVVAYKMDRFHRNVKNALTWSDSLDDMGKHFAAIDMDIDTSSPIGMAFYRIMAVLGQLERDQTAERTKMGLAGVRNDGRWVGTPPYGYKMDDESDKNGILSIHETESEVIALIFDSHENKGNSVSQICELLVGSGIKTRSGKMIWQAVTVRRILNRRRLYEGNLYKGCEAPAMLGAQPVLELGEEE